MLLKADQEICKEDDTHVCSIFVQRKKRTTIGVSYAVIKLVLILPVEQQ